MKKKVLSEIDLHYGQVDMPKGFEIDGKKLQYLYARASKCRARFYFN